MSEFTAPPEWGEDGKKTNGDIAWWTTTVLKPLSLQSNEAVFVASMLRQSCPTANLVRIRRIQNRSIWKNYVNCRDSIELSSADGNASSISSRLVSSEGEDASESIRGV